MLDILLPAWLTGIFLALITAPLGVFVVWRKMSYFGDTLAHSALLGVSLGFLLDVNLYLSISVLVLILAVLLIFLENNTHFSADTLLGIIAHSSLSFGIVIIGIMKNIRVDLINYLFGDLLSITYDDLVWILFGVIFILAVLVYFWRQLLAITINPELAQVESINVQKMRFILIILTALTIALSMKFVGALLITSLLIIPAAAARRFASSPEMMVLFAIIISMIAITAGLILSAFYDTAAGPSIVLASTMLFTLSLFKKQGN